MEAMLSKSSAEQVDWNEAWRTAQLNTSMRKHRSNMTEFWNMKAKRYDRMENMGNDRAMQVIDRFGVDADSSVIDIGCGPGTVSIPLARIAKSVTAVDPAHAMLDRLNEKAANEGLTNISILNKKWEEVDLGTDIIPHDVVVASYSLIMEDIREALLKMNAVAERGVCLFWFAGRPSWGNDALWPKLFGEEFVPGPDYIYLVNVLYHIGIHPNVEITKQTHKQYFPSIEDAVENCRENLLGLTAEQDFILRAYLEETLVSENGAYYSRNYIKTAMVWWQKDMA